MYNKFFKKLIDFLLSAFLLLILLPLIVVIFLIVWFETRRFPIFKQLRGLTHNNRLFYVYKFRTLLDKDFSSMKDFSNSGLKREHLRQQLTLSGRLLRKTGLDELPQLINVLRGEMSLIGPRPLIKEDLYLIQKEYPEFYNQRDKLKLKPGITGLWQINRDSSFSIESLAYWDSIYKENLTFLNDLRILLITLYIILLSKHKDAILPEEKIRLSLSLTILFLYTFFLTVTISVIF